MIGVVGAEREEDGRWVVYGEEMRIMPVGDAWKEAREHVEEFLMGEFNTGRSHPDHMLLLDSDKITTKKILNRLLGKEFFFSVLRVMSEFNPRLEDIGLERDIITLYKLEPFLTETEYKDAVLIVWCKYSEQSLREDNMRTLMDSLSELEAHA